MEAAAAEDAVAAGAGTIGGADETEGHTTALAGAVRRADAALGPAVAAAAALGVEVPVEGEEILPTCSRKE